MARPIATQFLRIFTRDIALLSACLAGLFVTGSGCSKAPDSKPRNAEAAPAAARVNIDSVARRVTIPAVAVKQNTYLELKGAIEYALVSEGGKEYESLFKTAVSPAELHAAFAAIGLRPGTTGSQETLPKGQPVNIFVEYESGREKVRRAIDELVLTMADNKPLQPRPWVYAGSSETVDPASNAPILHASLTRSVVGLHTSDASPLLQNARPESVKENIYRANVDALPAEGTPVQLVFERVMSQVPAGTERAHVFISGRVQGVGFRAFVQRQANVLGAGGFVRNLPDGRVEAIIEAPAAAVSEMLEKLKSGPRAAKVEDVAVTKEQAEGDFEGFEIIE